MPRAPPPDEPNQSSLRCPACHRQIHRDDCVYWQQNRQQREARGIRQCKHTINQRGRVCNNKAMHGSLYCHLHPTPQRAGGQRREKTTLMHIFFLYGLRQEVLMCQSINASVPRAKWRAIADNWFDGVLDNKKVQSHANRFMQWTARNAPDTSNPNPAWHLARPRMYQRFNSFTLQLYITEYEARARAAAAGDAHAVALLAAGQVSINHVGYNFTAQGLRRADGLHSNVTGSALYRLLQACDGYGGQHLSRAADLGNMLTLQQQCVAELTGECVERALARAVERRPPLAAAGGDSAGGDKKAPRRARKYRTLPASQLSELVFLFVLYGMRQHGLAPRPKRRPKGRKQTRPAAPVHDSPQLAPKDGGSARQQDRRVKRHAACCRIAQDVLQGMLPVRQVEALVKALLHNKCPLQLADSADAPRLTFTLEALERLIAARGSITVEGVEYHLLLDGPRRADDEAHQWTTFLQLQALDGYAVRPDQGAFVRVSASPRMTDIQRRCLERQNPDLAKGVQLHKAH